MSDLLDDLLEDAPEGMPGAPDAAGDDSRGAVDASEGLRAVAITADPELEALLTHLPDAAQGPRWQTWTRAAQALEELYLDPPDLLLVDERLPDMPGVEVVASVKGENVYRQLPVVLALAGPESLAGIDWSRLEVDDFLVRPLRPEIVQARLALTLARAHRTLDANPLSKLPGNTTIIQRVAELIQRRASFGLGYVDLDNFKAFNDKYGFSRGDEALMMTARLIVNIIREQRSPLSFVGHVGGDDFVFLLPADQVEDACQRICRAFDAIVPGFYDAEDRARGFIRSTDRQGAALDFPLMSLSIAVVMNHNCKLSHAGQAASMAAALKKKAKAIAGSSYVIDQRATC